MKPKTWRQIPLRSKIARWAALDRALARLTPHERERHFDMKTWGEKTECGTVACAAGHGSFDPTLNRMGFKGRFDRAGDIKFSMEPEDFFGERGDQEIFCGDIQGTVASVRQQIKQFIKELKAKRHDGTYPEYDEEWV